MTKADKPKITLKKLTLENFKNFQHAELELGPLTVLVGANATGKSNIREAFRFLQGIGRGYSLNEIISAKWDEAGGRIWEGMRGGTRELPYQRVITKHSEIISLPATSFSIQTLLEYQEKGETNLVNYFIRVGIDYIGDLSVPYVAEEGLEFNGHQLFRVHETTKWTSNRHFRISIKPIDGNEIVFNTEENDEDRLTRPFLTHLSKRTDLGDYYWEWLDDARGTHSVKEVFDWHWGVVQAISGFFQGWRLPDFNVQRMRQASLPGQKTLTDNGDNLSSVLHTICQNPQHKTGFLFWLRELTPMDVVDLDFFTDDVGQVRVQLVETGGRKTSAFSASDGTLRFLAFLTLFYSPELAPFYLFEEIEIGIHPARLYLLMQLMEEKVKMAQLQLLLTTHSPTILDLISHNKDILSYAALLYRLEHETMAHIRPFKEIPDLMQLAEEQGLGRLLDSAWFEQVMFFLSDDEPELEVIP